MTAATGVCWVTDPSLSVAGLLERYAEENAGFCTPQVGKLEVLLCPPFPPPPGSFHHPHPLGPPDGVGVEAGESCHRPKQTGVYGGKPPRYLDLHAEVVWVTYF